MLDPLLANPGRFALAVHDPAGDLHHRADVPVPVGSVFKVGVLAAVAREVAAGRLDPDAPVAWADVEAHNLPGTGLDVLATSREMLAARGVTEPRLRDVAWAMIAPSDNAATDYLIARAGPPVDLGPEIEPPMPTSGLIALWAGPDPRPAGWTTEVLAMPRDVVQAEAHARAAALAADPVLRARTAAHVARALDPRPGEIKRLGWTLPRQTARATAALMARIATDPDAGFMREILGWGLEFSPTARATFASLGYKSGVLEGLLAGAWYARRFDQAAPRAVVLILHDVPLRRHATLLKTMAMQEFERRLLEDDVFFAHVRQALTP